MHPGMLGRGIAVVFAIALASGCGGKTSRDSAPARSGNPSGGSPAVERDASAETTGGSPSGTGGTTNAGGSSNPGGSSAGGTVAVEGSTGGTVAVGGAAALIARSIKQVEVVAYEDLGPEAIRRLTVEDFPAIVANDALGGDLFEQGKAEYRRGR